MERAASRLGAVGYPTPVGFPWSRWVRVEGLAPGVDGFPGVDQPTVLPTVPVPGVGALTPSGSCWLGDDIDRDPHTPSFRVERRDGGEGVSTGYYTSSFNIEAVKQYPRQSLLDYISSIVVILFCFTLIFAVRTATAVGRRPTTHTPAGVSTRNEGVGGSDDVSTGRPSTGSGGGTRTPTEWRPGGDQPMT